MVISKTVDIETILSNTLKQYLVDDIKINRLFPDSEVKISSDHPFVPLLQQVVPEGDKYDLSGFPSITIVDTNTGKAVDTPTAPLVYKITPSILDDIRTFGRLKYILSKQDLLDLETLFKTNDELKAEGYENFKRSNMAIEIWTTNATVKNKLYDLVNLFLSASKWLFTLHTDYSIIIEDYTISGEKSGIYNFDFGEILYGAMIRFSATHQIAQYELKNYLIGSSVNVELNCLIQ